MKLIKAFIITWAFSAQAGLPPTTLSGDQSATKPTTFSTLVPNNQATQIAGIQSRIETGNTNLLSNPSFEHSTATTGWTLTNATAAVETTAVVEGKKSLKLTLSGALAATQDSSINAANLVGLQGVASIKIKTANATGLKVCARNAGVTSATLCVNVTADGTWKHVSIPFIMTATSNGIAITSTGTTGTVLIDDAFVGTSAPFQNVNSESVFSAKISSSGVVTDESGDFINGNCSVSTATFTCTFVSSFFTVAPNCVADTSNTGTTANISAGTSATASAATIQTNNAGTASAQPFTLYCQKQGKDMPLASKIYSQASQDYGWTPYTPTFTGIGTPSSVSFFHKRVGDTLYIQGSAVTGTVAASGMSMSLPGSLAIDSSRIPSGSSYVGSWARAAINAPDYGTVLAFSTSTSALFFGREAVASFSALDGNAILASTERFSLFAAVPIQGWSNYGVIVGSFAGIEKCANDYECTDTFSATVTTTSGVVSNENIDWINGNCTAANPTVCTFNTNLKDGSSALSSPMNCTVATQGSSASVVEVNASSSTSVSISSFVSTNGGAAASIPFTLKCQKGSQDYKPKTAKVASSIGVPTVPGIVNTGTGNAIDAFSVDYYGATSTTNCTASCTLDQIGSAVASLSASGTTYTIIFGKTYSKVKCSVNGVNAGTSLVTAKFSVSASNTATFSTAPGAGASVNSYGLIQCMGTY